MPSPIIAVIKRHPVPVYYVLVFAISWGSILMASGPGAIYNSMADPTVLTQFVYLAALAGPSIAGILMTGLIGGMAGLRDLRASPLRWQVGVGWFSRFRSPRSRKKCGGRVTIDPERSPHRRRQ